MSFLKYAAPALAVVEAVMAQSSCSVEGTTTISAAADATAIGACPTFSGSIALATDAPSTISFDGGLQEIDGNFVGRNSSTVQSLSGSYLERITGDFELTGLTGLATVSFNALNNIGGQLNWVNIPNLGGLTFGPGVQRIGQVTITDTQIQDLSGINLKSAQSVTIAQNPRLNTLSWQLTTVDDMLSLDGNGGGAGFNATFGNLASAGAVQVNSVNSLTMNALKNVTGTLQIYSTSAESLNFPNLTTTGDLNLQDNDALNNVSFPLLKTVKLLGLQRNPKLTMDVEFPALTTIANINCTGAFDELLLPKVNRINGAVNVASSGKLEQTCSNIQQLVRNNIITSRVHNCNPSKDDASTTGDGSSTGTSDGSSASSTAAAVSSFIVPSAVTFTSLFAAIFGLAL